MRCSTITFALLFVFCAVFIDRTRVGIVVMDFLNLVGTKALPPTSDPENFVISLGKMLGDDENVSLPTGSYKIKAKLRSGYEAWGVVYNNQSNPNNNNNNNTKLLPVFYFVPIGGYSIVQPAGFTEPFGPLARENGFILIGLSARLPPRKFLDMFEDVYDGLLWVKENAKKFGGDPNKIFVGGISAGGHLSIACALKARDTKDLSLLGIIALQPKVDSQPSWINRPSATKYGGEFPFGYGLSLNFCKALMITFAGIEKSSARDQSYANPISADLSDLPPIFLLASELDPLHDEAIEFAKLWKKYNDKCNCDGKGGKSNSVLSNIDLMDLDGSVHGGILNEFFFPEHYKKVMSRINIFINDVLSKK